MACTSNFAPFEEVKVLVSNSAEFFQKKCHLEDFDGFWVVRVKDVPNKLARVARKGEGETMHAWQGGRIPSLVSLLATRLSTISFNRNNYGLCSP